MNKKLDKGKPKIWYLKILDDLKNTNPFYLIIAVIIGWTLISSFVESTKPVTKEVSLNETFQLIQSNSVNKITLTGKDVMMELKDGSVANTTKEDQISFYELLSLQNIDPNLVPGGIYEKQDIAWVEIITTLAIPLLTILFLVWIFKQMGRSNGGLFSLGKSKAKLFNRDENRIGFKDVAGANEIKDELVEVVDFLKKPEKYRKLGARIPKGVLLIGPSGVGKTLLARAIAGEADVPFYSVAGSEFMEMIVGVGSARVRDLFAVAKETAPSLIFIDEIDAIGRHRGGSMAMSNDEREQTLNQILVEMDGFDPRTNVIIIAATNRPDILDTALVRPGRFDRHIKIDLPDINEREEIIGIHMRGKPFTKEVQINRIAKQTVGFSGADIENMLNEAAILAARREVTEIGVQDLTEASTKVKLGPGRKLLQTDEQRKIVAYHEAGHGLVSSAIPNSDPVTRISIVSRAMSLGHTQYLPDDDQHNHTKSKLLGIIASLLGGRAAEEVVFSEETVGASSDIERATAIARRMVTDFGMSDLGPINFVNDGSSRYVLDESDRPAGYSDEVARKIDNEVQKIIVTQYDKAKKIIVTYRETLDKIADELLAKETLEQDDFAEIVRDIKH
ncbi:MAG: cell division protease FtsH [Patescibacteria group bacterium]|nr:cell division protease FtsH [Patescibacteria group bacterium]